MRARRRAGAADTEASTESDNRSDGAAEAQAEDNSAPASAPVMREQRESVRYSRNVVTKSKAPLPKAILRRKKAQSYWSWAGPAAAVAAALVALLAVLGYYQYYLPASASNWWKESRQPPLENCLLEQFCRWETECVVCWDVDWKTGDLFVFVLLVWWSVDKSKEKKRIEVNFGWDLESPIYCEWSHVLLNWSIGCRSEINNAACFRFTYLFLWARWIAVLFRFVPWAIDDRHLHAACGCGRANVSV